jgi:CheY-like chemotaxis protein
MTILVVDDEPEYRMITKTILASEGWNVLLAEHGQEALGILKSGTVDMVVTDIYMPVMDGIKFHRTVRAMPQYENLPFLFVSAFDDEHTMQAIKDPKHDGFLRKARPVEEMIEWIQYLTTPEEKRPKMPPSSLKMKPPDRGGPRSGSSTPIY